MPVAMKLPRRGGAGPRYTGVTTQTKVQIPKDDKVSLQLTRTGPLDSRQAYGTPMFLLFNLGRSGWRVVSWLLCT